eukprot:gene16060-biopygen3739
MHQRLRDSDPCARAPGAQKRYRWDEGVAQQSNDGLGDPGLAHAASGRRECAFSGGEMRADASHTTEFEVTDASRRVLSRSSHRAATAAPGAASRIRTARPGYARCGDISELVWYAMSPPPPPPAGRTVLGATRQRSLAGSRTVRVMAEPFPNTSQIKFARW